MVGEPIGRLSRVEGGLGSPSGGLSELLTSRRIGDEVQHRGGHRSRIVGADKHCRVGGYWKDFTGTADVGRDDREPTGCGFQQDATQGFLPGRMNEHREFRHQTCDVSPLIEEMAARGQRSGGEHLAELSFVLNGLGFLGVSLADDDEMNPRVLSGDKFSGLGQRQPALALDQLTNGADEQDVTVELKFFVQVTSGWPRSKLFQVDAVVKHVRLRRFEALRDVEQARRIGDGQQAPMLIDVVDRATAQSDDIAQMSDARQLHRRGDRTGKSGHRETVGMQQIGAKFREPAR